MKSTSEIWAYWVCTKEDSKSSLPFLLISHIIFICLVTCKNRILNEGILKDPPTRGAPRRRSLCNCHSQWPTYLWLKFHFSKEDPLLIALMLDQRETRIAWRRKFEKWTNPSLHYLHEGNYSLAWHQNQRLLSQWSITQLVRLSLLLLIL